MECVDHSLYHRHFKSEVQFIDEDSTSYNDVQKKYKTNLQNLIKNLKTLNTPRYSLRKW